MLKLASKTLRTVPLKSYGRAGINFSGIRLLSNSPSGKPPKPHSGKSAFEAKKKTPLSDVNGEVGDEKTGSRPGVLYPVNREDELELLLRIGAHNSLSTDAEHTKPILAFTTQNFGSGKSFFGSKSPKLLRDDIVNNGIVHRRLTGQDNSGPKCLGLIPNNFTLADLEAFCDATVITVDMRILADMDASTLKSSIYQYIFEKATGTTFSSDRAKAAARRPDVLFEEIRKCNKEQNRQCNGHYVVFFDEIAALEGLIERCPYFDDVNVQLRFARRTAIKSSEDKKATEINAVYQVFLNALFPIIHAKDVYFIAAGKSGYLGECWTKPDINTSPLILRMFVLEPFRTEHIEKILRNTIWPLQTYGDSGVGPLTQKFGLLDESTGEISDSKMADFCSTFLEYTGGIPRFVQLTLLRLWQLNFSYTSHAALDQCLQMLGSDIISSDASIAASGFSRMTHQDLVIFLNLLRIHLAQGSLPKNYKIPLLDGGYRPLMSWIGVSPIYIKQDDKRPTHIQTVFCKYLIEAVKQSTLIEDAKTDQEGAQATVELLKLVDELQVAVDSRESKRGWISSGRVLELLLANFLICRLLPFSVVDKTRKTFAESFDFLSDTFLAPVNVSVCRSIAPVISLPAITKVKGIITRAKADAMKDDSSKSAQKRLKEFRSAETQYLEEYDILRHNVGIPCLPVSEKSAGPDITIAAELKSDGRLAKLMFATKNFHKTKLAFSDIEDEVKKAFKYSDFDDGKTPAFQVPGILVIVCTKLDPELNGWLHQQGNDVATESGSPTADAPSMKWKLIRSSRGEDIPLASSGKSRDEVRRIGKLLPKGCQLVVLNEQATEELLTERVVSLLRDLSA